MPDLAEQLRRAERALAEVTRQLELERSRVANLTLELERLRTSRTIRYTSAARRLYGAVRANVYGRRPGAAGAATLPPNDQYRLWHARDAPAAARADALRAEGEAFAYRPLVSLVMPVHETEPRWLRAAIASVQAQLYSRWELCVADDGSRRPDTLAALGELGDDPRIRLSRLPASRGISAASNEALATASGEFLAFLDHDDELRADALLEVVRLLNAQPDLDVIYTDEDKRRYDGPPERPFFKPDWSPDLLLSCNYITHLGVFRRELVERVGGLRSELDGSQDYDLLLRATELTDRIGHVAKPLYTWRAIEGSAAGSSLAKPWAFEAAGRALAAALDRRGVEAHVEPGIYPGRYRVRYALDRSSLVSVVVAAPGLPESLRRCVAGIGRLSTYAGYELLVVVPAEPAPEESAWLRGEGARVLIPRPGATVAASLNEAAAAAGGEALVFLHADTEVSSPQWLEALLEHCLRDGVGAAGLRLLGPGGTLEHEGVVVLDGGVAAMVDGSGAFFNVPEVVRNVSAVTGACLATRRDVFRSLEGFDERFPADLHAIDYCLRALEGGRRIVYTPHASLYHHRDDGCRGADGEELRRFAIRWRSYVDPYYNPNLSRTTPYALGPPGGGGATVSP